jgi:hypothetical protein
MDFSTTGLVELSDLSDEESKSLRAWGSSESKQTAAHEYIVDFSYETRPERWGALPPPPGPPLTEVSKIVLERGGHLVTRMASTSRSNSLEALHLVSLENSEPPRRGMVTDGTQSVAGDVAHGRLILSIQLETNSCSMFKLAVTMR